MINNITWKIVASIPDISPAQKKIGLAGIYAGITNNVLVIAGGSNFPDGKPWDGFKKKYWNKIYILEKGNNEFSCQLVNDTLSNSLAYGASVSSKNGFIIIGGENEKGTSSEVSLLKWDRLHKKIIIQQLRPLPFPLTNCSATIIGDRIFLVGGERDGITQSSFLSLQLDENMLNNWEILPPLPMALSHTAIIAQSDGTEKCIYVIGGRANTTKGISDLHGNVFCYKTSSKTWINKRGLYNKEGDEHLSAATVFAYGDKEIIIAGGDDGKIFSQIEQLNSLTNFAQNDKEKDKFKKQKLDLINHHTGFSRKVYSYNTITNTWRILNDLPYAPVTTIAVKWGDEIIIPCGEVKPGSRTANILAGKIVLDTK